MSVLSRVRRGIDRLRRERQVPVTLIAPDTTLLAGKVALVTGGTGAIGRAICARLAECGAEVVCCGSRPESTEAAIASLANHQTGKIRGIVLDVTDVASLDESISKVADEVGGKLHILVNAVGVMSHTRFPDVTEEDWERTMGVNAKGVLFVSQAVARHMVARNVKGHILNVSSTSALRPADSPYNMSKWLVRGLTIGMADALTPHGVIVNAIAPGPTATSMLGWLDGDGIDHPSNPSGRYATPDEIAQLAVLLVSGSADLVVGDTLYVGGGAGLTSLHR